MYKRQGLAQVAVAVFGGQRSRGLRRVESLGRPRRAVLVAPVQCVLVSWVLLHRLVLVERARRFLVPGLSGDVQLLGSQPYAHCGLDVLILEEHAREFAAFGRPHRVAVARPTERGIPALQAVDVLEARWLWSLELAAHALGQNRVDASRLTREVEEGELVVQVEGRAEGTVGEGVGQRARRWASSCALSSGGRRAKRAVGRRRTARVEAEAVGWVAESVDRSGVVKTVG